MSRTVALSWAESVSALTKQLVSRAPGPEDGPKVPSPGARTYLSATRVRRPCGDGHARLRSARGHCPVPEEHGEIPSRDVVQLGLVSPRGTGGPPRRAGPLGLCEPRARAVVRL